MKYYVISDVHGFYTLMKAALDKAGFDINDRHSKVILCGDMLDRGPEAVQTFEYFKMLNEKKKLIYIRGNHEDNLLRMLNEKDYDYADIHNGTVDTVCQFYGSTSAEFNVMCDKMLESGIVEFINENSRNYFETKHYIFTHGYIPVVDNWKRAGRLSWKHARWVNGMQAFLADGRIFGKKFVVGHYHCSWYRDLLKPYSQQMKDFSIEHLTKENGDELYAIDACTAYSGQVNVLVIED